MFTTRPNCKSPGILQLLLNLEQHNLQDMIAKTPMKAKQFSYIGWTVPLGGFNLKNMRKSNWIHFPKVWGEHKKLFETSNKVIVHLFVGLPKVTKRILEEALPIFVAEFLFFMAENRKTFVGFQNFRRVFFTTNFWSGSPCSPPSENMNTKTTCTHLVKLVDAVRIFTPKQRPGE